MASVRSKDTKPELAVRRLLHRLGYRFRLHRTDLPGKPDLVLVKHGVAIFVHGCFWHQHKGCAASARPSSNTDYWNKKLDSNVARDARNKILLKRLGWRVLTVWECETKKTDLLAKKLERFFLGKRGKHSAPPVH